MGGLSLECYQPAGNLAQPSPVLCEAGRADPTVVESSSDYSSLLVAEVVVAMTTEEPSVYVHVHVTIM